MSRGRRTVGGRHRKVDSRDRVMGRERFTADLKLPGMLHAKMVRSTVAHGRIESIDLREALAMDGVHAAITGADLPEPYGIIPWTRDETALATGKVRHVGEAVACVAAEDEPTAIEAAERVQVVIEPLPALFDPEEALDADVNIHEGGRHGNLSKRVSLAFGEVDRDFENADLSIEGDYTFHGTTHAALEPHCAVATYDPGRQLTLWSTTQVPHYLHRELARVLGLPAQEVRVIQPPVGGAFGGKSEPFDLEFAVSLLAIRTGRPVRLLYTREEVFYAHRGRHPMHMKCRTAFTRSGQLTAIDMNTLLDGGAYSSFGLVTTYYSGQLLCAPYAPGSYRFESKRVFTNKPACGPKRGHGSVQPRFALEVQLDKAADALGMDPIDLRRLNAMPPDSVTANEFRIGSTGFVECLDRVAHASGFRQRRAELPYGRGLGVAGSTYISGTHYPIYPNDMPQAAVQVTLDRSGRARIFSGASDIGQGSSTMLAVIVSEELGLPLDHIRVLAADTDLCPVDLGAYSSRITLMVGNACLDAARALRRRVSASVARTWGLPRRRIVLADGLALDREDPKRHIPLSEAFVLAESQHGLLSAVGNYDTPKDRHGAYRGGTIGASPAYSFTAHVAEVAVDVETGEVEVVRVWVAHDAGRPLSRGLVEGQMEGATYMGLSEALFEHHDVDPARGGVHRGPSLLDYKLPSSLDVPPIESLIVEAPDPAGPYGAKEAGEGPLHSSIPAVINAVHDAVGVWINTLPLTPERVLAVLDTRARMEADGTARPHKGAARSRRTA